MNMKKILLALGIGAGVGAACYFAKKKLDEMYYDMCAAPPYVPSPAGPAKRPAATAEKKPTPDAPAVFFVKKDPQITVSRMRTRCPA